LKFLLGYNVAPLILADTAFSAGCQHYSDLVPQLRTLFSNPELILITSIFGSLANYTVGFAFSEPILGSSDVFKNGFTNASLILNDTAYVMMAMPPNTTFTITSEPNPAYVFFQSASWLAMRWFYCPCFIILAIYPVIALCLDIRRDGFVINYRESLLVSSFIMAFMKMLETGIDPFGSTQLLSQGGLDFLTLYLIFFYCLSTCLIILAWLEIESAVILPLS